MKPIVKTGAFRDRETSILPLTDALTPTFLTDEKNICTTNKAKHLCPIWLSSLKANH
jgi:hypothetical protein